MAKKQSIFEYLTLTVTDLLLGDESLEPYSRQATIETSYVINGEVKSYKKDWEGDFAESPPTLREINDLAKQGWRIVSVNVTEFNNAENHRNLGGFKVYDKKFPPLKTTSTYYTLSRIAGHIDAD